MPTLTGHGYTQPSSPEQAHWPENPSELRFQLNEEFTHPALHSE
jgi:hypothetical protein